MKTIYVNKEIFKEAMDYLNRDITFYEFLSYTKAFLKQLLSNSTGADIEPYLKENGLTVLEEICPLSARVVVNQVSMKMENERITNLLNELKKVL